ncbi:hypothetical protein [Cellulomonas sp. NPDC058312]|uniref:hypothetical protein n=1 Tax=Cellulomonas sp. NPDC058312 TaxID=3346441 RepID=UPI0036E20027
MVTTERWTALLGELVESRMALAQAAPAIYPMTFPGARPTADAIRAAEGRLGFALDAQHAALLGRADGWVGAFGMGDLLSTADLGAGPRWSLANDALDDLYLAAPAGTYPPRDQVYPVHTSTRDVFVVWAAGPPTDGGHPVLWIGNGLVDQWANVSEFCRGIVRLNEVAIESLGSMSAASEVRGDRLVGRSPTERWRSLRAFLSAGSTR